MAVTVGLIQVVGTVSWPYSPAPASGAVTFTPVARSSNGALATIGQVDGILNTSTMQWTAADGSPLYLYGVASGQPVPYGYNVTERLYTSGGVPVVQTFQVAVVDQGSGTWNYNTASYPTSAGLVIPFPGTNGTNGTSLTPKGAWAAGTYNLGDTVSYSGRAFASRTNGNTTTPPSSATDSASWMYLPLSAADMLRSVYDVDLSGFVDAAEGLRSGGAA